jgi:hypothetical protein
MSTPIDFLSELGAEDGSRFMLLLERRPKWLLLLLHLRKRVRMSIREAMSTLKLRHESLRKALRYLTGIPDENAKKPFIASTRRHPLVSVEMLSYNEKFIVLTEYGWEFTNKVVRVLKKIALRYGRVDVESELGIPRIVMYQVLRRTFLDYGIEMKEEYEERIVDWQKLIRNLSVIYPLLVRIMEPEILEAIPVKVETTSGSYILYVIQ